MDRYYAYDTKRRGFLGKGFYNGLAYTDPRYAGSWGRKQDAESAIRLKLDRPRPEFRREDVIILRVDIGSLLDAALRGEAGVDR